MTGPPHAAPPGDDRGADGVAGGQPNDTSEHTDRPAGATAALFVARGGRPVFPCRSDKSPRTEHGLLDATTDERQILVWWRRWPDALIGVPTGERSGMLVVDVDRRSRGVERFEELVQAHGGEREWPAAPAVRTPSGGLHYYFSHIDGIRNSVDRMAPGVDVRADGGYVIVPPSPGYEFCDCEDEPLPDLPGWLADLATARSVGDPAEMPEDRRILNEGRRNDTLARLAGSMRRVGMEEAEVLGALVQANRLRCRPPLDEREVATIARSIARYAPDQVAEAVVVGVGPPDEGPEPWGGADDGGPPTPWRPRALDEIPAREWVYGRHLLRGALTVTAAPGGTGKSSLAVLDALSMATGRDLAGHGVGTPRRVWYLSLEDSRDEIDRRIAASMAYHGIAAAEVSDRLMVDCAADHGALILAREIGGGGEIDEAAMVELRERIAGAEVDAVMLDPLAAANRAGETNEVFSALARALAQVAAESRAAIEIFHHTRKPGLVARGATVHDIRGGGALIDAARCARMLHRPTDDPTDGEQIFRVAVEKSNMAATGGDMWYRLHLAADGHGDRVGVATLGRRPSALDGITAHDLDRVLARLRGEQWMARPQSPGWVGHLVAEVCGIDADDPAGRSRLRRILGAWVSAGALVEVEEPGPHRHRVVVVRGAGE